MSKTSRAEFRIDEEVLEQVQRAAELVHEHTSEFMRRAVFERMQKVLQQEVLTMMPAAQFDALLESLDHADEAPALAELAQSPRVFKRR